MKLTPTKEEQKESKFIAPGPNEVKVTKVEGNIPATGSPYLNFTFENRKGQTTDGRLYTSEAAMIHSKVILEKMLGAAGVTGDVDGKDAVELGKSLTKAFKNKYFRHRFTGEEVKGGTTPEGKQKSNWFKATIGRGKFDSESIEVNPSRLRPLDVTNAYDWKTLPVADELTTQNEPVSAGNDLPF